MALDYKAEHLKFYNEIYNMKIEMKQCTPAPKKHTAHPS